MLGRNYQNISRTDHVTLTSLLSSNEQINVVLLAFSLAGFLLPGYLFYHRRNLLREKKERNNLSAKEKTPLNEADPIDAGVPVKGHTVNGHAANGLTA